MEPLYCDLETFSPIDIECGTHKYAEQAEILLFPYAIGDEEPKCWDTTLDPAMPEDLRAALMDPNRMTVWHNGGMFDATILRHVRPGGVVLPHDRIFDTMACAYAHALPGSLDMLCTVLGVEAAKAKLKTGKQLINLFCKPRPKNMKLRRATRETHPEEWAAFVDYAKADITSMREVYKKLPKWNYKWREGPEYALWVLDQKINQRGVAVDLTLAAAAVQTAETAKEELAARAQHLTQGAVQAATQRDALLEHLFEEYGVHLPDLRADTIERRLNDPTFPEPLRDLLRVRLQATSTSVRKYETLLKATSTDGRLRGLLQWNGAGRTGRWSGRLFQPQNLPRPSMKKKEIELAIDTVKARAAELVYDNVMDVLSNCIRGTLIAPEGRKLVVTDLSNIEGRMAAWLAGEDWKVKYFHEYDVGRIEFDNYVMAYSKSFDEPPEEVQRNKDSGDGSKRQIGKVQELMLQYGGRVGAFVTGAATYRIDLEELAGIVKRTVGKEQWERSKGFYNWAVGKKMPTYGISEDAYIACDVLTVAWRESHPAISSIWQELENAFRDATNNPGVTFNVRGLKFLRTGAWLRIRLPSGRFLCYPSPKVHDDGSCSYMGQDQYTRKWQRQYTYGGKLLENITQAASRDVMAHAIPLAESAGYEVVLTVHDELITEAPDAEEYNVVELSGILATVPDWASGLPLAAAGFEAYRYRKD